MKLVTLALLATLAAPLAYAQTPDGGAGPPAAGVTPPGLNGQGGPGGRQSVSPEQRAQRRAALQTVMQACQADVQTLCGGQGAGGGKVMMCIRDNRDKVSAGCKGAIAKLQADRRQGRGRFGPGRFGQGQGQGQG